MPLTGEKRGKEAGIEPNPSVIQGVVTEERTGTASPLEARSAPLKPAEKQELAKHEEVIAQGLGTFFQVGIALSEIKGKQLYREEYASFEEYCEARWSFRRNYAVRLIRAANATRILKEEGNFDILPETEFQARELSGLKKRSLLDGWRKLLKKTGHQMPTTEEIKDHLAPYKKGRRRGKKVDQGEKADPKQPPKSAKEADSLALDAQRRLKRLKKDAARSDSDIATALEEISQIRKYLKELAQG